MQSSSGRILVYDIGAKNFRIQSKTRVLFEKQTDHMILTASIGRDGSVAVATRADGAESMLTVYDKNHKETFKWACAKEHIVSCDVSDNGRMFVVAVLITARFIQRFTYLKRTKRRLRLRLIIRIVL